MFLHLYFLYHRWLLNFNPMKIKPTGVDLVNGFLDESSTAFLRSQSIASLFPSIPFPSGWKANINGVDLKNLQPVRKTL